MTRFQKLAATTVAGTLLLVTLGVVVRATDSGLGCPDWPFCYGQVLPSLGRHEGLDRVAPPDVAAILGLLIVAQAVVAFLDHRDRRSLLWPSIGAVAARRLPGLPRPPDRPARQHRRLGHGPPGDVAGAPRAARLHPRPVVLSRRRIGGRGSSQRFTLLAAFGAAATYALLLFGSHVTATDAALIFPDWPLMGGTFFPPLTELTTTHVLHRWVAVVVGLIVAAIVAVAAWRTQREHPVVVRLALSAAVLFSSRRSSAGSRS